MAAGGQYLDYIEERVAQEPRGCNQYWGCIVSVGLALAAYTADLLRAYIGAGYEAVLFSLFMLMRNNLDGTSNQVVLENRSSD